MTTPTRHVDGFLEKRCGRCGEWWPLDGRHWRTIRGKLVSPCRDCSELWNVTPSTKPKRWTPERIARLYADYASGLTLKQVGKVHGLRPADVRRLFVKNGLERRGKRGMLAA